MKKNLPVILAVVGAAGAAYYAYHQARPMIQIAMFGAGGAAAGYLVGSLVKKA